MRLSRALLLLLFGTLLLSSVAKRGDAKRPKKQVHGDEDDDDDDNDDSGDDSIETVTGEKIQDAIDDNDRNMLVIFFDTASRCPACKTVLTMLEDIDDDIEETGWVDVVKTTDKHFAKDLGVHTFPSIVYFRRSSPIFYDGDFSDPQRFMKWVRSHDEVAVVQLKDDDFEERTDSATPAEGALDWFVYFYDSRDHDCSQHQPTWETVAHHLRGMVHVGRVDTNENDDVAERFRVESLEDCPSFVL